MDDARELQYGVGFETSDADSSIEQLTQKVDELEQKLGAVEMGAQKFGAGTVSACTAARNGAAAFSDAADDAAAAAQNVGNATSAAEKTTRQFGNGLDDAGDDADARAHGQARLGLFGLLGRIRCGMVLRSDMALRCGLGCVLGAARGFKSAFLFDGDLLLF